MMVPLFPAMSAMVRFAFQRTERRFSNVGGFILVKDPLAFMAMTVPALQTTRAGLSIGLTETDRKLCVIPVSGLTPPLPP